MILLLYPTVKAFHPFENAATFQGAEPGNSICSPKPCVKRHMTTLHHGVFKNAQLSSAFGASNDESSLYPAKVRTTAGRATEACFHASFQDVFYTLLFSPEIVF